MILFVNVFVTEARKMGFRYNRYGLPWHNRLDIFKYALASLSALNPLWSKVVLYIRLDKCFLDRWGELEGFIYSIFDGTRLVLRQYRSQNQTEWQKAYTDDLEGISDSLIWYQGNDDHIFIDSSLDVIKEVIDVMYRDTAPYISCIYSHWPEYIRYSAKSGATNIGCAATFNSFNTDAIHIVTKEVFHRYWFTREWKGNGLVRTDFMKWSAGWATKCYVPYKELVRHFDGYSHSMQLADCCPPLYIPTGFFKNDIKILYGAKERQQGWTAINPLLPYRTVSKNGVDHRYMLDEIPLFWRDRISEQKEEGFVPTGLAYRARNASMGCILDPGRQHAGRNWPVLPAAWMSKYIFRSLPPVPLL